MQGRTSQAEGYRYGFQNQEEDEETGWVNYKYRMHNPSTGRFFAVDPLASKYPFYSPYAFSGNRVVDMVELEGLEPARPGQDIGETQQTDGSTWGWTGDEWAHSDPGITVTGKSEKPRYISSGLLQSISGNGRRNSPIPWTKTGNYEARLQGEQYRKEVGTLMKGISYSLLATNAIEPIVMGLASGVEHFAAHYGSISLSGGIQWVHQSYMATHRYGWSLKSLKVGFGNIDAIDAIYSPFGGLGSGFGAKLLAGTGFSALGGNFDLKLSNANNIFDGGIKSAIHGTKDKAAFYADFGVGIAGSLLSAAAAGSMNIRNTQTRHVVEYRALHSKASWWGSAFGALGKYLKYSAPSTKGFFKDPVIQQGIQQDMKHIENLIFVH